MMQVHDRGGMRTWGVGRAILHYACGHAMHVGSCATCAAASTRVASASKSKRPPCYHPPPQPCTS